MSAAIQGIYIALFGRPADPGGLAYWTEVTKGGADLSAMLSVLPNLTEYTARFEGQTPDQVITTVYQNLFGRAPDAEGLAFFKGQLASGAQTLATIAVNIMQGAQGDDKADVTAKVSAAELFTASLDTQAEIDAYKGADAAALAKKFLDTVDKDKPATPESVEKAAGAVVAGQDPTGGQAPNPGGGSGGGGGGTPLPASVREINAASRDDMLATLKKHAPDVFETAAAALFGELPTDQGRQKAVAYGVHEQIQLFGSFASTAQIRDVVTFHTQSEHAKFTFIKAVQGANTQAEMLSALELAKGLNEDRQELIAKWSSADAPQAAKDRAAVLASDDYSTELKEISEANGLTLKFVADKLVASENPFYGDGAIITHIKDATAALTNIEFSQASAAGGFEPKLNLDIYLAEFAADGRITDEEFEVLAGATSRENAIKLVWDYVDDNYSYYNEAINSVGVDLSIYYAKFLQNGGSRIMDIVKFTADNGDADDLPQREQPMHHNLLLNLDEYSIVDKFGKVDTNPNLFSPSEIQERITKAGLIEIWGEIGNMNDGRPGFNGNQGSSSSAADAWDTNFFKWDLVE